MAEAGDPLTVGRQSNQARLRPIRQPTATMALVLYRPLSFFHPLPVVALDTDQEFTLRRVLQDLGANEPGSFFIGFCEIHACQIVFSCRASRYQVLSGFACRHHDHGRIEDVDALMRCVRLDKMLQDACLGLPAQLFREKLESVAVSIASGTLATSGVNTGYTGWTGWIFSNISSQLRLNLLGPGPLSQTIPQFVFTLVMQAAVLEVRNLVPQMYRFIRGPSQQIVAANNGAPVTFADQDETSVTSGTFIDHDATSATASLAPVYTKCNILLSILPATTKAPQAELGDSDAPRPMRGGPAGVFFNMATRPSTKSVAMAVVSSASTTMVPTPFASTATVPTSSASTTTVTTPSESVTMSSETTSSPSLDTSTLQSVIATQMATTSLVQVHKRRWGPVEDEPSPKAWSTTKRRKIAN